MAKRYSDFEALHMELGDNIAFPSKAAFALNFFAVRTIRLLAQSVCCCEDLACPHHHVSITLSCTA